jgi:hemerythrin-like metal-binding protein
MALFEWSKEFETGVSSIDTQHKVLVDYVNRLDEGKKAGQMASAMSVILDGLVEYTATHFAYEEKIFDKISYSDSTAHKALHGKLVAQVVEFRDKLKSEEAEITDDLMNFLKQWLIDHIQKEDMKYVSTFKENHIL